MKVTITKVDNGYVVKADSGFEDDRVQEMVFQEKEDYIDPDGAEVDCFEDLLWSLNELIGPCTSRYSKKRIHIDTQPGDKYMDSQEEVVNNDLAELGCVRPEGYMENVLDDEEVCEAAAEQKSLFDKKMEDPKFKAAFEQEEAKLKEELKELEENEEKDTETTEQATEE